MGDSLGWKLQQTCWPGQSLRVAQLVVWAAATLASAKARSVVSCISAGLDGEW